MAKSFRLIFCALLGSDPRALVLLNVVVDFGLFYRLFWNVLEHLKMKPRFKIIEDQSLKRVYSPSRQFLS